LPVPLATLAVLTWLMATDLVSVRSSTLCPSADEVATALRRVLPNSSGEPTGDVAFIEENLPWLEIKLRRADGSPKGEKSLRPQGRCAERAELVATVIAIWEPDLQQPALERPRRSGMVLSIGGAAGVTLYKGIAGAGLLEGVVDWQGRPWGIRMAMGSQLERRQGLDIGEVGWRHTTAAAGLRIRTGGDFWRFAADGGPIVGWASLSGYGYSPERHGSVFEYGFGAGARVERVFRRFALWLEGRAHLWSKGHEVVLDGSSAHAQLSQVDLMANLGLSFELFR
jgi:hypothetical protein